MVPVTPRKTPDERQQECIKLALAKWHKGIIHFKQLAHKFNVVQISLQNWAHGGATHKEAHAHQQKVPPSVEKALEDWHKQLNNCGFPPCMDLSMEMALVLAEQRTVKQNNPELLKLRQHWIANFLDGHPTLAKKIWVLLDWQWVMSNNVQSLCDCFRKLQRLLWKHRFQSNDIYNMDAKGFVLGYSAKIKVICRRGSHPPRVTQDGTQELVTVIECSSAGLVVLPSVVIYKGAGQYMGWHSETSDPDTVFASAPNDWSDDDQGLEWIKRFYTHTFSNCLPLIQILGGHRSHFWSQFCQNAFAHNMIMFCLPTHSTYLPQPLDVGLFGSLPQYNWIAADDHMQDTLTGIVKGTSWQFYSVACTVAYTANNIKAACHKTAIFLFNPDSVSTQLQVRSVHSPVQHHSILIL